MRPPLAAPGLSVLPHIGDFAADVDGLQVTSLDDHDFDLLYNLWLEYRVIRLPQQVLTDADLVSFSRRFGELDIAPPNETLQQNAPEHPEILVVSNVKIDGQAVGILGASEAVWHTDMSYIDKPPMASMLYAIEVPAHGGDTEFMDMIDALACLPTNLRQRVEALSIKHDATTNSAGYLRRGVTESEDLTSSPGSIHPGLLTHPETGAKALYLGRRHRALITGLSQVESDTLLDDLWHHVTQHARTWKQAWRPNDLVIWDNRVTMHRRDAFDDSQRRRLHRTQIQQA